MADAQQAETLPGGAKPRRRFTVDALFSDGRAQAVGVTDLPTAKEIRLDRIEPDPEQPRRTFDPAKLAELADSIRQEGILQPIAVRYDPDADRYVILHGERRWRASQLAGLTAIAAVVRDVPRDRRLIQQLMENIVRDDLNAVDRAAALRALKLQLGDVPWETVAAAVGIRRSRLFQLLGTEKLPATAREDLRSGRLNEKQSRALQGLPPVHQDVLRAAIVAEEIPAAEAIRLAKALRGAGLPDDREAITVALAQIRRSGSPPEQPAAATGLLALIASAASGSRVDRAALAEAADRGGAPAYSAERLAAQVLALAQSLARLPAAEVRSGGQAYPSLVALASTLNAIFDAPE
ncbi:MAG: ParB/RepB/Spo0J family partition protein [Chloroflexia bacterium]|nr:ParB/RepB/Spo0J family partition protein [Chloroflexia bacterium]